MDYHAHGQTLVTNNPDNRTISSILDGRKLWFKQPVPPKARIWHFIQKMLSICIPNPILRVTVSQGGAKALRSEGERLLEFKAAGFHVPDVIALYDDMLIMTDAGPQLRTQLDQMTGSREEQTRILKVAITTMAKLHQAGFAHGRPYMRDMTWDGKKIGFLDLEEDPLKVMPLRHAQARDIWIFLSAASRFALMPGSKTQYAGSLIDDLYTAYAENADSKTLRVLRDFVFFLKPAGQLLGNSLLWNHIGRDARQSIYVNRCLEECLKDLSSSLKIAA